MRIQITCDSTCDLTRDIYDRYNLHMVSMGVVLGEELRHDGKDVTLDELFSYVKETGKLPKTSAISVGEYEEVFRKYVEEGCQIIHISLSSELSCSYQNACTAAELAGNVRVIDSKSLSTGSGQLAVVAAELVERGHKWQEIGDILEAGRERLDVSFIIQTLDYLHKGGRCSGMTAFGANVLKLRPEIELKEGTLQVGRKYRGSMNHTIQAYIRGRLEPFKEETIKRIFLTHSGVPESTLEQAKACIMELQPNAEIIVTVAGCTIASHCGPNCLGVLFFRE